MVSLYSSNTVVLDNIQSNWRWTLIEQQIQLSIAMGLTPDAAYHLFDRLPSKPRSHLADWMHQQGYAIAHPLERHYVIPADSDEAPAPKGSTKKTDTSNAFSQQFLQDSVFLSKFDAVFGLTPDVDDQTAEAEPILEEVSSHDETPAGNATDDPSDNDDDLPDYSLSASPEPTTLAKQSFSKIRQLLS